MTPHTKHLALYIIFLQLLFQFSLLSQSRSDKETPSNCEDTRAMLDLSLVQAAEIKDSYIIYIFHLGKDEKSKKVINRRMDVVRNHIKFRNPTFNRHVLAEGEKIDGLGSVE